MEKSPLFKQFGKDWLGQRSSVDAKLTGRFGTGYFHGLKDLPQRSLTSSQGEKQCLHRGRIQSKSRVGPQNQCHGWEADGHGMLLEKDVADLQRILAGMRNLKVMVKDGHGRG